MAPLYRLAAGRVYPSSAAREAALASGMEEGVRETMEQLAERVVSLP